MTAARYRAALATLGRSAPSLAPLLRCHPRTCQQWLQDGPPPEILAWLEAGACEIGPLTEAWLARVPVVRIVAGRPARPLARR